MYDPPHLMKSVRNNLVKHDFLVDGNKISWKYITEFHNFDSQLQIRMAPKLTKKHIELPPFAAMRVCLAAEALSHTVAAGISTYVALGMPDEAIHTAEFVEAVDGLFDCFNSRNLRDNKPLHRPITDNSQSSHWTHLQKCAELLHTLKICGSTASVPCVGGWLMNINALQIIWSVLKSEYKISFLLTSRLNQDSLENLFSIIRGRGGHRDNPGPVHFQSAFKQVIVQNMFMPAASANCRHDSDGDCVLSLDDFTVSSVILLNDLTHSSRSSVCQVPLLAADGAFVALENKPSCTSDMAVQNTLMYVTGYVCRKVLDKHRCQHCRCAMLRNDTTLIEQRDMFCVHKAYNVARGSFGGLKAPSQFMFELLANCEDVFASMFDAVKHGPGVRQKLNKALECYFTDGDDKPCMVSQKCAADLYLRTRIHYKLKFMNRDISLESKVKRKDRKALKVLHK